MLLHRQPVTKERATAGATWHTSWLRKMTFKVTNSSFSTPVSFLLSVSVLSPVGPCSSENVFASRFAFSSDLFIYSTCPVQQLSTQMRTEGLWYSTDFTVSIGVMNLLTHNVYICINLIFLME